MGLTYPDINATRYDWSSIEIDIDSFPALGFTAIDYKETLEPGEVRTNSRSSVVGRTRGQAKANGSFEMHKAEWASLVSFFGPGYKLIPFNITVQYADTGMPVVTDRLLSCRIVEPSNSPKEGNEPPKVKVTLHIVEVWENGIPGVDDSVFVTPYGT